MPGSDKLHRIARKHCDLLIRKAIIARQRREPAVHHAIVNRDAAATCREHIAARHGHRLHITEAPDPLAFVASTEAVE